MTIKSVAELVAAYDGGRSWAGFMKRSGPVSVAGYWQDLTYAAGIPAANYYAATPVVSATLSPNDSIMHGPSLAGTDYTKYLHKMYLLHPQANIGQATFHIHDIVMYYPFVDGDGGSQDMINSVTNRYGGAGCTVMLVSQGVGLSAGDTTITYVDKDDVTRTVTATGIHTAPAGTLVSSTVPGTFQAYPANPYWNMPTGIKTITNINVLSAVSGIFAAVIVKPLGTVSLLEGWTAATAIGHPVEKDFLRDTLRLPELAGDAYVGMIYMSSAGATPTNTLAEFNFVWG